MRVKAGATDQHVYFYIQQDAGATNPGEPVTGLVFSDIETGGSASYVREGAARTDLTLITLASASATHADGGFIEVDATNMPGLYRCDYPDAAFATGADHVYCQVVVASSNNAIAAPVMVDIDTGVDVTKVNGSAASASNLGLSASVIITGAASGTPTTAAMATDLSEATDDHYKDRTVIFTSGVLLGQATGIASYTGSSGTITFSGTLTEAATAADTFVIV